MLKKIRLLTFSFLVIFMALASSGCFLLAGVAVGVGGYVWVKGEMEKSYDVSASRLHSAATKALRDLKVAIDEDTGDRISAKIKARFSDGAEINIHVAAKTERASTIKIRVGILGDKERSEMIINAVERRL